MVQSRAQKGGLVERIGVEVGFNAHLMIMVLNWILMLYNGF